MASSVAPVRDPGLQPERTALSWRRTIMSAVVADLLIWRGWLQTLTGFGGGPDTGLGLGGALGGYSAHVVGMGVCAAVAALTTIVLVVCAAARIRLLHSGVAPLESEGHIAVPALIVRTASAAIVTLAATTVCALALGM
ncbi:MULTISPECIES: DUF202 domain-containing protein [Arthrobacter]|uniref:DUF202 domain-containing protein n=1 Tax=Arthrobacter TaxID=1663 RepID=UPI0028F6FF61|nr:DUF202 domain-containing protein [Arthrobacter sp. lap29]